MMVEIKRDPDDPHSVPSKVYVNGIFECYGLEPARSNPVHSGHPCIAAGTFVIVRNKSPHLGYITPELLNVPGRSDIRWHVANYPKDLLGCLGVGTSHATDFVGSSKTAFDALMKKLNAAWDAGEEITAIYSDPETAATLPPKE